ncbi:outer membrane protein assembly factor BamD [Candidatus Erwinia haradaeae]|uniref:Outer membrane protein assembly factor BamD n=1 Tax=Candidatus Erwinia haradaeae TaxID=1922217 RepID=A0A803FTN1_9GAMM|nr:outer membrane protein assembly factor BamD [Candidatus Erwinia haradaeae]VFP88141.1 Outer membrane protein assembly factor BamD [Candidatus Erwinia haradaeae]
MIRIKHLVATSMLSLLLVGCSGSIDEHNDKPPIYIYKNTKQLLHNRNLKSIIKKLETFCMRYPPSPHVHKAQLDLIYAYYKNNDFTMALELIDRFIRINPDHQHIDYVIYMRGLINMTQDKNLLQDFIGIDRSDRDLIYTQNALKYFTQLLRDYPKSVYSTEARNHVSYLTERQAKYELSVAEFYSKHRAYVAVINRVKGMLRNYPNTKAVNKALPLMNDAYHKLKIPIKTYQKEKTITTDYS